MDLKLECASESPQVKAPVDGCASELLIEWFQSKNLQFAFLTNFQVKLILADRAQHFENQS